MPTVAEDRTTQSARPRKIIPPKDLVFRCVVYPNKPEEYTAECIDLDIMVRRATPHAAMHELEEAVTGYLNVAFKGDVEGLVPRPSPLSHRARYHVYALRAGLSGSRRRFLVSDLAPNVSLG